MNLLTRAPSVRIAAGPAGSATDMVVAEELLSGLSGASITSTITITNRPHCHRDPGAPSYDCSIAGELSKFGGSLGAAQGSTNLGVIGPQAFYAAIPIVLTANGGNFTGGAVRIAIHYLLPIAPQT